MADTRRINIKRGKGKKLPQTPYYVNQKRQPLRPKRNRRETREKEPAIATSI